MRVSTLTVLLVSYLLPVPASSRAADPCNLVLLPQRGDPGVIGQFQERVKVAEDPVPHLERLGWAFVARACATHDPGFYKLAEQCALCIEARQPGSAAALLLRVHVLSSLHRFREAENLARRLVTARGMWFDHAALGDALMEQGQLEGAVEAYQHMLNLKPGPQAYSRAAHVRWLKGDLPGAIELMRKTARAGSRRDPEAAAWAFTRLALYEMQAGRPDRSAACVDAALDFQPEYAPALLARGRALLARRESAKAVRPLTQAVEQIPLPEYQWALVEALAASGRQEEAARVERTLVRRGILEDPRTVALYLASAGRDSRTALRLARDELQSREDVITLDVLAWSLRAAGKMSEARAYSGRALREGTREPRLFYHAGVIAAESGDTTSAARLLRAAASMQQMLFPSEREHLTRAARALREGTGSTP